MIDGDIPFDATQAAARPRMPEFPPELRWVNRRNAPRLADWRGQVTLLLFWNGSSVSSANLLGELRQLEKRLPRAFMTVCVHVPRYASQQADTAVLKAAHRERLRAPVANDPAWVAWKQYSITAWPTTLLVDANGGLAARWIGEGRGPEIEDAIIQLRDAMSADHAGPGTALVAEREVRGEPATPLAFPAHALATESRLYVSDTDHHRVLECTHDGRVLRQFGSGTPGHWDGHMSASGLQSPHGLALDRTALYVADTGNHCVRRIRLESGDIETVLGSGRPAYTSVEEQGGGARVAVNAPHAVAVDGNNLYVAATGQHQLLRLDLRQQRVTTLAGDGRSDVRDGIGAQTSLSQPMALAMLPGQLLIADAGGNAVRRLRLSDLALTTLAGASPWETGLRDGAGAGVRLAYPCGIAATGVKVYVADTFNDRLCTLDPYSGALATLQFDTPLHEPQGLSFGADALWVADRNDHAILRVDPEHGTCERVAVDE